MLGRFDPLVTSAGLVAAALATSCDRLLPSERSTVTVTSPTIAPSATAASAPSAPAEAAAARASVDPTIGGPPIVALAVPGFAEAVVSVPISATGHKPLVVALHGNYDRPEWQCGVWRRLVGDRAFVLCPRGVPRDDSPSPDDVRFTYRSFPAASKELDAAIEALRARFPEHVDDAKLVYTGFSLGAIFGVPWVMRDPARAPRVVLVEGGHDKWTPATMRAFVKRGGAKVLFACGQAGCETWSKTIAKQLDALGIGTRVVYGKGMGHSYDGAVAEAIARELDWLVEGDARW